MTFSLMDKRTLQQPRSIAELRLARSWREQEGGYGMARHQIKTDPESGGRACRWCDAAEWWAKDNKVCIARPAA